MAPLKSWRKTLLRRPTINFRSRFLPAAKSCPRCKPWMRHQSGTVEIGHSASYYYFGKDPTFAFGTSVAFGPNQRQNQAWMIHGGGMDLLNNFYKKFNVTALMAANTGCQMGGWFRKEINTVDDLKGLKFRIGGFPGRVLAKLGVVPQQIAGGDIFPGAGEGHHRRRRMGRSVR